MQQTFKSVAYQVIQEAGRPLHINEITEIAIKSGQLKTVGKTPAATMSAQIIVDINKRGDNSQFIKTAPSTFFIRELDKPLDIIEDSKDIQNKQTILSKISSKQKGDIAEARIAELITLYGDNEVSCFKPISDDEGIDLIVKPKGKLKSLYIQIKSRFGDNPSEIYTASVKKSGVVDHYAMAYVFCYFDTEAGDLWDYVWLVPAPEFVQMATPSNNGTLLSFVAGRKQSDNNKWDKYLIKKTDLSEEIIKKLSKI